METNTELNWLVDCILKINKVSASYAIICFDDTEFKLFHLGNRVFVQITNFFIAENFNFLYDFIQYFPDYIRNCIEDEEIILEAEIQEHGKILTIKKLFDTHANCVKLDHFNKTTGLIPYCILKEFCPIYCEIMEMKKKVDFVIVVPKERFNQEKRSKKLGIMAHEAFHIVEHCTDKFHTYVEIESKLVELINECQKFHEGFY